MLFLYARPQIMLTTILKLVLRSVCITLTILRCMVVVFPLRVVPAVQEGLGVKQSRAEQF